MRFADSPSWDYAASFRRPHPLRPLDCQCVDLLRAGVASEDRRAIWRVEGKEADARSDTFSLGAVVYEMVTGKRAFEGKSPISVASAILEKEPEPITSLQPLAPAALEHVVRECLVKDPELRWQNSADIARELRWIKSSERQRSVAAATSPWLHEGASGSRPM